MDIVKADVSDGEEILALQKQAYLSEARLYNDDRIDPLVETISQLQAAFSRQVILKAIADGNIVGSIRGEAELETCRIGRLSVHPDYQNRGIGASLMREIERYFPQCRRFELFTGSRSDKNIYLYRKLGFVIVRMERVNDRLSFVHMRKTVPE